MSLLPAAGAIQPFTTSSGMGGLTVTITGLSIGTVVFAEADGIVADPFIAPSGTFIQDHTITTNLLIRAMVIHFCRDRGTGRLEIWSDYGGLYNHGGTATDLGAHTATIRNDAVVIATVNLAKHGWHQGWRWQQSERPWFRALTGIYDEHLLMPMDFDWCAALAENSAETESGGVFNNYAVPAVGDLTTSAPGPLAKTGGLMQNMFDVGGRPDIGPLTGWTACWMYGGNITTTTLRAHAEIASSSIPSRKMDENTFAPLSIYDHRNITWHPNNAAAPEYVKHTEAASGWSIDYAHMPNCCAIPYMFTEDPYYLRGLQFTLTRAWWTRNLRWSSPLSNSLGPFPDNEVRGHAYVWRDAFNCWKLTPSNAPSWMNPKSYFAQLLTDWSVMWERIWITNAASVPVWTLLRTTWQQNAGTEFPAWAEHWAEATLGMGVYLGVPDAAKWRAIWEWKTPFSNYHNNANPDWDRRYGIKYREEGGGSTWAEHYALQLLPPPPVPGTVGPDELWDEPGLDPGRATLDCSYEGMGVAASAVKLLNGGVSTASDATVLEALTWRRNAIANSWGATTKKWSVAAFESSGDVGPLEPINGSALQVDIDVGTSPRQTWVGYGWGAPNINITQWTASNVQKLCEDMGATVVRYHTPETGATFVNDHLAHWNLVRQHGIDTIFASCYVYRTANAPQEAAGNLGVPSNSPNIVGARNGLNTVIASINPSNGFYATLQNEPDGNSYNHPTNGGVGTASQAQIRSHHQTLRSGLNNAVRLLGLEWRHPQTLITEFDDFNSNGLYEDGTVQGQCFHIYDDGARPEYYDDRLQTVSKTFFSTETGDNGHEPDNLTSPYTQARFIAGFNHGVQVEINHAAIGGVDADGKVQCLVNASNGTTRPWYQASRIISKHMIRGTVMRLCLSSDRPTNPTLPDTNASRMIIEASGASPCQPRQLVGCGRRPDGRFVLVGVNFAYDSKNEQPLYAGGHYAAILQQLTVTIPELGAIDRVWSGERATRAGSASNTTVNMQNGQLRFTLQPGETIAITQAA